MITLLEKRHDRMWTTSDELKFLDNIGTYGEIPDCTQVERLILLEKYIESMEMRRVWNTLDTNKIKSYVYKLIAEIT